MINMIPGLISILSFPSQILQDYKAKFFSCPTSILQVAFGRHMANDDDQNQDPQVIEMITANKRARVSSSDCQQEPPSPGNNGHQQHSEDSDCEENWVTDYDTDEGDEVREANQFKFV
jgi:hypothetical protein